MVIIKLDNFSIYKKHLYILFDFYIFEIFEIFILNFASITELEKNTKIS